MQNKLQMNPIWSVHTVNLLPKYSRIYIQNIQDESYLIIWCKDNSENIFLLWKWANVKVPDKWKMLETGNII